MKDVFLREFIDYREFWIDTAISALMFLFIILLISCLIYSCFKYKAYYTSFSNESLIENKAKKFSYLLLAGVFSLILLGGASYSLSKLVDNANVTEKHTKYAIDFYLDDTKQIDKEVFKNEHSLAVELEKSLENKDKEKEGRVKSIELTKEEYDSLKSHLIWVGKDNSKENELASKLIEKIRAELKNKIKS